MAAESVPSVPSFMSVNEFAAWARLGRTKVYEILGAGEVAAIKIGRRTLIRGESAAAWMAAQPAFTAADAQ